MNSSSPYVGKPPAIRTLVPIRVASRQVLEGEWTGPELTGVRVVRWLSGPHHILQIGYENSAHHAGNFRIEFAVHMPVLPHVADLDKPEIRAEAERTAWSFLHMLNLRRRDAPSMADYNEVDVHVTAALREPKRKETP